MAGNTPKLEDSFGFALHHASFIFKTSLKDELTRAGFDMTTEEFVLLAMIPEEGVPQGMLVKKALKDKTTITRLVDRLVAKDWVVRRENPHSRREQIINVTSHGEQVRQQTISVVSTFVQKTLSDIPNEETEIAKRVLYKVISALT